jgi:hypothetical protein
MRCGWRSDKAKSHLSTGSAVFAGKSKRVIAVVLDLANFVVPAPDLNIRGQAAAGTTGSFTLCMICLFEIIKNALMGSTYETETE